MEALAIVSLAGNILQFVDFSCKFLSNTKQIYQSRAGSAFDAQELKKTTKSLQELSQNLINSRKDVQGQSVVMRPARDPLVGLARGCEAAAGELLVMLGKLKAKDPESKRSTMVAGFKSTWKEREIKDLETRIEMYRSQLMIQLQVMQNEDWKHITALINRLHGQNQRSGTDLASHVSKLTLKVESAVDHWNEMNRQQTAWAISNSRGDKQATTAPNDEERDSIPHVANLIWQEFTDSSETMNLILLNSLAFHLMEFRHSEIRQAHPHTFDWVFESLFQDWLTSSESVFWISGKPGSGKSTLMKFLVDNPKTPDMLRKWSGTQRLVMPSYFFWINGTALQRSQEGLLRALLYEILRQSPEIIEDVLPDECNAIRFANTSRKAARLDWPRTTLLGAFKRLGQSTHTLNVKYCIFIDGLDEFDTNAKSSLDDLINTIGHLCQLNIKLCVASRPWNEFEDAYGRKKKHKIYLQELNKPDIQLYVSDNLESRPEFKALRTRSSATETAELLEEVINKAQGVFLWVYLVVRSLIEGLRNRDRMSQLRARLGAFPSDLDDFFRHIFKTLEPMYRMQTAHMFQVALVARTPLTPIAYWFMDEAEDVPDLALNMPIQAIGEDDLEDILTKTNARLNGRCRGLLEITPPVRAIKFGYRVDFLHRTVRDFFTANAIYDIFVTDQQTNFNPNLAICNALLGELKSIATLPVSEAPPLLEPLQCFFHAAQCVEKENNESPVKCLFDMDRVLNEHIKVDTSRRVDYLWTHFGRTTYMGVIIAHDMHIYAKARMVLYNSEDTKALLGRALVVHPFSVEMFDVILSAGTTIPFDYFLQQALATKLKLAEDMVASMVEVVLRHSYFIGSRKHEACPLASAELWAILTKRLPANELSKISNNARKTQRRSKTSVKPTSRNPFRRLWN